MNKDIKISIIIPMYNSEKTILKSLSSVLKQSTLEHLEIIIINDGSSDDSRSIVQSFIDVSQSKNRTLLLINQTNKGASSARNAGLKASSGEYIAFLDADDYFHPQKLECLLFIFLANPCCDVIGHSFVINADKFKLINIKNEMERLILKKVKFYNLLFKNFATTPSVMFKNKAQLFFDESMSHTEDHDFFLRFSHLNPNMFFLDYPLTSLGRAVLSVGGLSASKHKMRLGEINMYLKLHRLNKLYVPIIPCFIMYSALKHITKVLLK